MKTNRYSIETDGIVVWVNGNDGICWGRFSRYGIDIYNTWEGQLAGKTQLACVPGEMKHCHWDQFVGLMAEHHQVTVPDFYMPTHLADADVP